MNIGQRVFVVEGDEVTRLSQKVFHAFFFLKRPELPQYAGQTIVVATVLCQNHNRVPQRVIRTDSMEFKVKADGSLDQEHLDKRIMNALKALDLSQKSSVPALPPPKLSAIAKSKMHATILPDAAR